MKVCKTCKQHKKFVEFHKQGGYYKPYCKDCEKQYAREYYQANLEMVRKKARAYYHKHRERYRAYLKEYNKERQKRGSQVIVDYKKAHPCEECGETDYRCLVFHHPSGKKETEDRGVASLQSYKEKRILEEIAKCQILCANCHSIKHYYFKEDKI